MTALRKVSHCKLLISFKSATSAGVATKLIAWLESRAREPCANGKASRLLFGGKCYRINLASTELTRF
jgi:hypothetical protein